MRVMIVLFTVVLFLIAVAGLGYGLFVGVEVAEHQERLGDAGVVVMLASALVPFLIGTVALGFVTVMLGIDRSRSEQLIALDALIKLNHERETGGDERATTST